MHESNDFTELDQLMGGYNRATDADLDVNLDEHEPEPLWFTERGVDCIPERFAWLRELAASGRFVVEHSAGDPFDVVVFTPRSEPVDGIGRIVVQIHG